MVDATTGACAGLHLVLLHGAGLGGWIWDRVLPDLAVPAEAVDLPGRGAGSPPGAVTLQQCIDAVGARTRPGAVLVGHSFSAEVAMGVAASYPRFVAAVVLVGGVVPANGRSFLSLLPPPQRLFLSLLLRFSRRGITLPASLVRSEYCSDLDDAATDRVLASMTPEAPRLYLDRLDWSALPGHLPRYYVKLLGDKSVAPKQQDRMIDRIGATRVESLPTGHLPMLARPHDMAAALNRLVAAIDPAPGW